MRLRRSRASATSQLSHCDSDNTHSCCTFPHCNANIERLSAHVLQRFLYLLLA